MLLQQFNKENENINMPVEIPPSWICTLLFDNRPTDRRFYRICDKEVMVYIKEYNTVLPMPSNQQCKLASFLNTCYVHISLDKRNNSAGGTDATHYILCNTMFNLCLV